VGAEADDGDAERLEALERRRDVEDRLDPAGDDRDSAAAENTEIGGFIEGCGGAAMNSADPAGGENSYAGLRRKKSGRSNGRPTREALGHGHRQIADAELQRVLVRGKASQLIRLETDPDNTGEDSDRCRHRTVRGDRALELDGRVQVFW
jgi:hypothetical protein